MKRIGWAVLLPVRAIGSAHHSVGTLFDLDATIEIERELTGCSGATRMCVSR